MSDPAADDPDLLAAEYVLGVLDAAAADAVVARAGQDPMLAAAITAWERRLAPLAALVPPAAPPPGLWTRIERALDPAPAPRMAARPTASPPVIDLALRRQLRRWQATAVAAVALAAALAAFVLLPRPTPSMPGYVAALAPANTQGASFMAEAMPDGALVVTAIAPVGVADGKDLELWALPEGAAKPVSLGVLPPAGKRLAIAGMARPRTQLMVSLEPKGGSPTGQPTGPVLFAGTLARIE